MTTELDTFYEMVEDIGVAMMTTRSAPLAFQSRAMANQKRAAGADLWFVTAEGTGKLRGLEADPHINLVVRQGSDARMDLGVRRGDNFTRSAEDSRAVRARLEDVVSGRG